MQARVFEFLKNSKDVELLITKNDKEAKVCVDAALFLGYKVFLLPDLRADFGDDLRSFRDELFDLFAVLNNYFFSKNKKKLLITPIRTVIHPLPDKKLFKKTQVEFADTLDINSFKKQLHFWGYSFVDVVEDRGEVSFRGDIIDIYSIQSQSPVRISLFDNEVESIRHFECETQKSVKGELENISIFPAYFSLNEEEFDLLDKRSKALKSDSFMHDIPSLGLWVLDDMASLYVKEYTCRYAGEYKEQINEIIEFYADKANHLQDIRAIPPENIYKDIKAPDINSFLDFHGDKKLNILARNEAVVKGSNLQEDYRSSVVYSDLIVNVMSADELIVSLNKQDKAKKRKKSVIVLDELKPGDYIVHENYGIGIFKGLINTTVLGSAKDFVQIIYQNDDKLLLPVENIDVIDRYISEGGSLAVLDRLGKGSFQKIKAKTRIKLFEIAKEIIEVAAKRELIKGKKIDVQKEEIKLFQNDSGFIYTDDQKKSTEEIFEDCAGGKVMDRLLSGDVGFGKTEVAMNIIFASVKSGYQAAFIAPTTLLVLQHYKSLKERFERYGIKIAKLDRFVSAKDKKGILQGLKDGVIDVCVGTHSLFGTEFNNLSLLVVDEEHKFGVKQKEKLKNLKENIHVLSMSATPIPRSLNMALSSVKQYSCLMTPPKDREDVRTFVKEYDEKMLKEVFLRELRRNGQIFYIHNRIATIEEKKKGLLEILPNIKILVLHSKISTSATEKEMLRFENQEYDLLLSTSIIESGIHLPNVNTIIVESSDNFGMADLHQLRGRVGRANRQGYCYFLVENKDILSENAKKRLVALESNSFLGSGSVLAYHDLEIRGGGNLIGEAQSGHIKNIGYSLYLKMLEDSINELLNKTPVQRKEVDIKLAVAAYISSDYISEDRVRLELYRRLGKCENVEEVYEIEEEMYDRFGKIDIFTKQFLDIIVIKILSSFKNVKMVANYNQNITFTYENDKKTTIKANSKDDDDLLEQTLKFLHKTGV